MSSKNVSVGRPSKLDEEMIKKAKDYVENYKDLGDAVPTLVGLALHLGVSNKTIYNWAVPENDSFLHIFNMVEQKQHRDLVNGGLVGGFNPAVSKMMLTKHGYSDKVEQVIDAKVEAKSFSDMYGKSES